MVAVGHGPDHTVAQTVSAELQVGLEHEHHRAASWEAPYI